MIAKSSERYAIAGFVVLFIAVILWTFSISIFFTDVSIETADSLKNLLYFLIGVGWGLSMPMIVETLLAIKNGT